jgi:stage II sporulation protein M
MNLINIFEGRSMFEVITMIFLNNAKAALLSILLGVFFGIFPVAVLIVNGYLVGFTGRIASEEFGLSIMLRLIPHGIFELPAILISVGLGLKMGMVLLKERKEFKKEFKKAIKFYLLVILPLLLIASIVEGILVFLE